MKQWIEAYTKKNGKDKYMKTVQVKDCWSFSTNVMLISR